MRGFLKWLTAPDVAPLLARLLLVALTALAAGTPEPALAAGALLESAQRLGLRQ